MSVKAESGEGKRECARRGCRTGRRRWRCWSGGAWTSPSVTTQNPRLVDRPALSEAMIVSTCKPPGDLLRHELLPLGVQDVVEVLHEMSGVDIETLRGYL